MPPSWGSSTTWTSMKIPDDELRALVRSVIANRSDRDQPLRPMESPSWKAHASHSLLPSVRSGDGDDQCLIEPAVLCNHCGFCRSLGH